MALVKYSRLSVQRHGGRVEADLQDGRAVELSLRSVL
jgi:hypothetical protein